MIIIGEKINSTRKSIKEAIANKDKKFLQKLAADQAAAGADYIDVNTGAFPEEGYSQALRQDLYGRCHSFPRLLAANYGPRRGRAGYRRARVLVFRIGYRKCQDERHTGNC